MAPVETDNPAWKSVRLESFGDWPRDVATGPCAVSANAAGKVLVDHSLAIRGRLGSCSVRTRDARTAGATSDSRGPLVAPSRVALPGRQGVGQILADRRFALRAYAMDPFTGGRSPYVHRTRS